MLFKIILLVLISFKQELSMCFQEKDVLQFLVKIEAKGKFLDCAGTIVSSNAVLTSGHCMEGLKPNDVTITHVTDTVNTYDAKSITMYPKYDSLQLINDVAVIITKKPFEKPWKSVTLKDTLTESDCTSFKILGWSTEDDKNLKKENKSSDPSTFIHTPMIANVKIINRIECALLIKTLGGTLQGKEILCGVTKEEGEEEHDNCFTGPGGPLICSLEPKPPSKNNKMKKLN